MYDKTTKVMNRATVKADQNFRGFNRYGGSRCARTIPETEFAMISVALTARRISWWILASALALTVVEGAIRKWVIGSAFQVGSYAAYFSKDIVFTLLLLVPACRASAAALETFRSWLLPGSFLLVCGVLTSMSRDINLAGAVLTLRAVLLLPAVAFVAVSRLQGISLRSVAMIIGVMTILNFPLGVLQNQLPPHHILNRYASDTLDITTTVTGVRATGTFSYITGMAVISVVGMWAGMVYMSLAQTVRQQMFGWAMLACGLGCGLASVSRGPILIGAFVLLAWLLFSGEWASAKSRSVVAGILVLGILVLFELTTTFFDLGQGLLLRAEQSHDSTEERSLGQFEEAFMALQMAPSGNGLGTEQVGRYHYSEGKLTDTTFESQLGRLVLETGVFGLAGFVVICVGPVLALQVAKRHSTARGENAALLATQLFLVSMFTGNVVFNHTASAFAWMIFAAVMGACSPNPRRAITF